jgi:hypothetical protein
VTPAVDNASDVSERVESAQIKAQTEIGQYSFLAKMLIALTVLLVSDERLTLTQKYLFEADSSYLTRMIRFCVLFWPQIQTVLLVYAVISIIQKRRYHMEERRLMEQVNNLLRIQVDVMSKN